MARYFKCAARYGGGFVLVRARNINLPSWVVGVPALREGLPDYVLEHSGDAFTRMWWHITEMLEL